ncbi:core histone H2A/H2B/H3/H4 [Necator americanus]|uniref:Histone H4 n=1 Tax=Necator americanus TaxID=51031 RepID=W2SVD7_NECAM|nr:core histone H2A/H2B/H3/H4 [Necator americanus]ETN73714.1 core histone H2A/H2B/H3/H4 [Necator americanus]
MVAHDDRRRSPTRRSSEQSRYLLRSKMSKDSKTTPRSLRASGKNRVPAGSTPRRTTTVTFQGTIMPRLAAPPLFTSTPRRPPTPYPRKKSRKKPTVQPRGITKADIRRVCRKAGVPRIGRGVHEEVQQLLENFLQKIIADVAILCDYYKRKTVLVEDIHQALQRQGRRLYGVDEFDGY